MAKKMFHFVGKKKKDGKVVVYFTNAPNSFFNKRMFESLTGPFKSLAEAEAYKEGM